MTLEEYKVKLLFLIFSHALQHEICHDIRSILSEAYVSYFSRGSAAPPSVLYWVAPVCQNSTTTNILMQVLYLGPKNPHMLQ